MARYRRRTGSHRAWASASESASASEARGRGREAAVITAVTLALGSLAGLTALSTAGGASHARHTTTAVSVLGEELTKPPAVAAQEAPASADQLQAGTPAVPVAAPSVAAASGLAAPAVAVAPIPAAIKPAPVAPPTAPNAVPVEPIVIHAFNQPTFSFSSDPAQDTAASSSTTDRKGTSPVLLEVDGRADNGAAAVSVKVTNDSGHAIDFPGGLSVAVTLSRDGSQVASTTASDPGVLALAPSATTILTTRVPLSSYGSYSLDGVLSYRSA